MRPVPRCNSQWIPRANLRAKNLATPTSERRWSVNPFGLFVRTLFDFKSICPGLAVPRRTYPACVFDGYQEPEGIEFCRQEEYVLNLMLYENTVEYSIHSPIDVGLRLLTPRHVTVAFQFAPCFCGP